MSSKMSSKNDELIALDPDFSKGETTFFFPNGDFYEGEYCAHRTGIVWRQGLGTYTTKDGQTYAGEWRDDKLVDNKSIEVTYPSGVQYVGRIVKNKYTGPGLYVLENKMSLLCEFLANKPTGEISLIDITGREWHGIAEQNEALLIPEHIYFNNINEDRGKGQVRTEASETKISKTLSERSVQEEEKKQANAEHMREREQKIFAKTHKTISDLKFEDSRWFKHYKEFKQAHEEISKKIKESGEESLEEDQKLWYEKYMQFKKRYFEIMEARKHNKKELSEYKLFELFNSDQYKNSYPPLSVVCATEKPLVKELMFKDRKA